MKLNGLTFTYDSVNEYISNVDYELLSKEYANTDTKLKIKCDKGHIFDMSFYNFKNKNCRCPECVNGNRRKPYEEIQNELKKYHYDILTPKEKYKGSGNKLEVKCQNEHIQNISFNQLKYKNFNCSECYRAEQYQDVVNLLNSKSYTIITKLEDFKNYQTYIEYYCDKGHYHKTKAECLFSIKGCQECANIRMANERKLSVKNVKEILKKNYFEWISGEYINIQTPIKVKCSNGHISDMEIGNIQQGKGCRQCYYESLKGEGHWNWQGGLTTINYILRRETMKQWKIDSLKQTNFKCCLTSKETHCLEVHHINKNFKDIVSECLEELGLQNKNFRKDITDIELEKLKKLFEEKHLLYGLGIPLDEKLHGLFHGQYTNKNNTPQQFISFITRLTNGEFSDFLKENNLTLNVNYKVLNKLFKDIPNSTLAINPKSTQLKEVI